MPQSIPLRESVNMKIKQEDVEPLQDGDLDPDGGGRRTRALVHEIFRLIEEVDRLRLIIEEADIRPDE